jgi:hypothetical protein
VTERARRVAGLLGAAALVWSAACASPPPGAAFVRDALAQLEPGVSREADVRRLLGPPHASGALHTGALGRARRVWGYEWSLDQLAESIDPLAETSGDLRRTELLVFWLDGRYDGHQWSASQLFYESKQ